MNRVRECDFIFFGLFSLKVKIAFANSTQPEREFLCLFVCNKRHWNVEYFCTPFLFGYFDLFGFYCERLRLQKMS
uniref:Uncharacterized protein n=1 Tax=Rhizophora mucronata TaxID=61149 RepID=A0A2P2NK97_RHIMU